MSYGTLKANVQAIRKAAGGRHVVAVCKADAYGLGLERCSRIYHESGISAIAVATLGEADRVRSAVPECRVILLGAPLPEERPAVVASGYEVLVSTDEEVQEFAQLANPRAPLGVHVNVDTGMGRFGALPEDGVAIAKEVLAWTTLRLAGVCSHYPMADNAAFTAQQEQAMTDVLARIGPLPEDCWIHYANSEGLLLRPAGPSHAVRVGLILTGVVPEGCPNIGVKPAIRWVSSLSLVKHLPKGHGVSYNHTRILERDTVTGIVPVGYADGYPIGLSNKSSVLVQGIRCPVLGRVTMDYLVVDLTDLPVPPSPGEAVVLFGPQGNDNIPITEIARLANTIPYDILCGLRGRCEVVGVR